jgi:Fic family protein
MNYKKQPVKRYLKIDKLLYRKYHINDFNFIVTLLYPHRQTINKFSRLLTQTGFTRKQQELINQTAKSLTIINEFYRDQDSFGSLYTTREDMANAIFFLQNELHLKSHTRLLPAATRWFYKQVQQYFFNKPFTNKQIRTILRKSSSSAYRHLTELVDREFIEIVGKKQTAFVYKLTDKS